MANDIKMKLIEKGVHKKLSFLIQHCNGYDEEYHILSLSKKLNIDIPKVRELFKELLSENKSQYIELLENGINIEGIIELAKYDRQKLRKRLISIAVTMNYLV